MSACPNFRDVGATVNALAGKPLLIERRLYRGGSLDRVGDLAEVGCPGTIVNLRRAADVDVKAKVLHVPADNSLANYETMMPRVRKWLADVVQAIAAPNVKLPMLVHCVEGKDRAGIATAAVLALLGVPRELIVDEYLASEGDVMPFKIVTALRGVVLLQQELPPDVIPRLRARYLP